MSDPADSYLNSCSPSWLRKAAKWLDTTSHGFLYETNGISYLGYGKGTSLKLSGGNWSYGDKGSEKTMKARKPFSELRSIIDELGGSKIYFGYVSFDAVSYYYDYPLVSSYPAIEFFSPDLLVEISDGGHKVLQGDEACLKDILPIERVGTARKAECKENSCLINTDQSVYMRQVGLALESIASETIDKVIISRRQVIDTDKTLDGIYCGLKEKTLSSYGYMAKFDAVNIVGCSPEILLRCVEGEVTTIPLAGTRPRGFNEDNDNQVCHELLRDEKEVFEHCIAVSVALDEVRSVCDPDSVRIGEFMGIIKFPYVQHVQSRIKGRLQSGKDMFDALEALFPAITISGKPKDAAIRLIGQIEKEARGPYSGAIGLINLNGGCELPIIIRSAYSNEAGKFNARAGAGIVRLSSPEKEYYETKCKIAPVVSSL